MALTRASRLVLAAQKQRNNESTSTSKGHRPFLTFSRAGDPTPWASSQEWLDFYDRLFSPDPLQIQEALSIEALWQLRGGLGRRSALYQVTANLTRLIVLDPSSDCKAKLSFAIIRFISLVTDHVVSHRDRVVDGQMTMKKSCTALGIPSFVVDMRHDIVHSGVQRLSTSECFAACQEALAWLKTFYWERERTIHLAIASTMSKSQDRQLVRDALDRFAAESGRTRRTLKSLTSFAHAVLCEQLVDGGYYLIPKRQLWIAMYDDKKELMRAARKSGSSEYFVPDSIIATWRPLIDQLAKSRPACMRSLFARLCQTIISATATDYTVVAAVELIRWLLTYVGDDDSQRVLQWRLRKIASQLAASGSCHAQLLARDIARRIKDDVPPDAVQDVDTATPLPAENESEIVEPPIKRTRIEQVAGTSAVAQLPTEAFGIAPNQTLEHLHSQLMLSIRAGYHEDSYQAPAYA